MSNRLIAAVAVVIVSSAAASAEPLRWGWTLTSATGQVLGTQSGLTAAEVNFALLAAPTLPMGPATPDDPSHFPDVHVKSATTTATLTLTDEVSGIDEAVELFWTKKESWLLLTRSDGSTSAEVQDSWDESGPRNPAALRRAGGVSFLVEQVDGLTFISAAPAEAPEPGTILLGGIAVAGGVGACVRRRMAKAG
jgi:hypothetical protein